MSFDVYDFYKSVYFYELDRRERLLTRIQVMFGLHLATFTPFVYMMRNFRYDAPPVFYVYFGVCTLAYVLKALDSIVELKKAFWGHTYLEIAVAKDINQYHLDSSEFNKYARAKTAEPGAEPLAVEPELDEYLKGEYIRCASRNSALNDQRALEIHEAGRCFLAAIGPLLIAGAIFVFGNMDITSERGYP